MTPRTLVAIAAGLLLLLTYLLVEGTGPDAARHERTLDALRASILNDAALQRDVLRARAGLQRNYDPLVQSVANLRRRSAICAWQAKKPRARFAPRSTGTSRRSPQRSTIRRCWSSNSSHAMQSCRTR
jgi:hypothetical protein